MVLGIQCLQKQDIPEVIAMIKETIIAVPPTFYNGIQLTAWVETIQDIPSESDRFSKANQKRFVEWMFFLPTRVLPLSFFHERWYQVIKQ